MGACLKSRERKHLYRGRKKCYGIQRNETKLSLSGKGGCRTDLVVGKYAQIRQSTALEWNGKPKKSPHKRSENTDEEPPDHGRRMSSRQTLGHI